MSSPASTRDLPQRATAHAAFDEAAQAFAKTAVARSALDPTSFASLTVDVGYAVDVVLAALPRLRNLHVEFANLPIDLELIGQLEAYTLATAHAQALLKIAMAPPKELDAVYREAFERRGVLKLEAMTLARHGLLNLETIGALPSQNGYRNVAYDLMSLIALFRQADQRLLGRTVTQPEDLARTAALATKLLKLAAVRESRRKLTAAAKQERLRAFTLMHKAYNQVRRAVRFVCWDQTECNAIAPSFYGPQGGRRRELESSAESTADDIAEPYAAINAPGIASP